MIKDVVQTDDTDGHGLKRHGWAERWNGLICLKAIQSIDTARLRRKTN